MPAAGRRRPAAVSPPALLPALLSSASLPGPQAFDLVAGAVLAPLGLWLALTRPPCAGGQDRPVRPIPVPVLVTLSMVVGCVGGIYGIGGGSILAPILIASGRTPSQVAPLPWPPPS